MDKTKKTQKIIKTISIILGIIVAVIIFLILWAYFIGLPAIEFCDSGCEMGKFYIINGKAGLDYLRNMILYPQIAIFMIFLLFINFMPFSLILLASIIVLIIYIVIKKSKHKKQHQTIL